MMSHQHILDAFAQIDANARVHDSWVRRWGEGSIVSIDVNNDAGVPRFRIWVDPMRVRSIDVVRAHRRPRRVRLEFDSSGGRIAFVCGESRGVWFARRARPERAASGQGRRTRPRQSIAAP